MKSWMSWHWSWDNCCSVPAQLECNGFGLVYLTVKWNDHPTQVQSTELHADRSLGDATTITPVYRSAAFDLNVGEWSVICSFKQP